MQPLVLEYQQSLALGIMADHACLSPRDLQATFSAKLNKAGATPPLDLFLK